MCSQSIKLDETCQIFPFLSLGFRSLSLSFSWVFFTEFFSLWLFQQQLPFQNTRETVNALRGMKLKRAIQYLKNVQEQKEIVPTTRYRYGVGRHAQVYTLSIFLIFLLFLMHPTSSHHDSSISPFFPFYFFLSLSLSCSPNTAHFSISARPGAIPLVAGPRRAPSSFCSSWRTLRLMLRRRRCVKWSSELHAFLLPMFWKIIPFNSVMIALSLLSYPREKLFSFALDHTL